MINATDTPSYPPAPKAPDDAAGEFLRLAVQGLQDLAARPRAVPPILPRVRLIPRAPEVKPDLPGLLSRAAKTAKQLTLNRPS